MLLELIDGELRRPDQARLEEIDGRWWLRDERDIAAAALPLSDRVEWAVFSLLSTAGGLTEAAFFDRIATMFRGHDTPDEALVRACLDSYRSRASTPDLLRRTTSCRHATRTTRSSSGSSSSTVTGSACAAGSASRSTSAGPYRGAPLLAQLSEVEQRAYLPLISRAHSSRSSRWTSSGTCATRRPSSSRSNGRPCSASLAPQARRSHPGRGQPGSLPGRPAGAGRPHPLQAGAVAIASPGPRARQLAYPEGRPSARPRRPGWGRSSSASRPDLGLDPEIERGGEQLPLFE